MFDYAAPDSSVYFSTHRKNGHKTTQGSVVIKHDIILFHTTKGPGKRTAKEESPRVTKKAFLRGRASETKRKRYPIY